MHCCSEWFQTQRQGHNEADLTCFSSLRNYIPALSLVQHMKRVLLYIYPAFWWLQQEVNLVLVAPGQKQKWSFNFVYKDSTLKHFFLCLTERCFYLGDGFIIYMFIFAIQLHRTQTHTPQILLPSLFSKCFKLLIIIMPYICMVFQILKVLSRSLAHLIFIRFLKIFV